MFVEPNRPNVRKGWIEVICGAMFSGKTEELIRRLKRARIANQQVEIFKHTTDKRYSEYDVVSHDGNSIQAIAVNNAAEILLLSSGECVVGIDEAQFFGADLVEIADQLASKGMRVIVAGLDMDYTGRPFGPIPMLLAKAEFITKLHAICVKCGDNATFSYRKDKQKELVMLGEKESYEPRCRSCFNDTSQ